MSEDVKSGRRRYDASGRRARAEQTRADVVTAATRLFAREGYGATTIAAVAREAAVSPETIYKAFGSKAALLRAAALAAIRGDPEPLPLRRRPEIEAIRREPDPARKLALYADVLRAVQPRLAPLVRVLREASSQEPEIAEALAALSADRLDGMAELAAHLESTGALRPGVGVHEARDLLWTLNSPEVFELLVLQRGWTVDRYAEWVGQTLKAALLG